MKKLYFATLDSEMCHTLDYHLDDAKENGLSEIELYEAIPDNDKEYFFCRAVGECAVKGDCGKHCEEYDPRNGKFGICRYKGKCYTPGNKLIFKV